MKSKQNNKKAVPAAGKRLTLMQEIRKKWFFYLIAIPGVICLILFCYLPDLPRLFRFLSALELLQMKGAILCFDFQAGALRPLCGDKVELQIIDFAEFERRFLTSP